MGKSFVYNMGSSQDTLADDEIELELGVFFDGTLNNLYNTDLRIKHRDREDKEAKIEYHNDVLQRKEKNIAARRVEQERAYNAGRNWNELEGKEKEEYDRFIAGSKRSYLDKLGVDNSYSNDYSNVARIYKATDTKNYAVYVEGIGTLGMLYNFETGEWDKQQIERDVDDGFQMGKGPTGIRGKVRKGCEMFATKIKKLLLDHEEEKSKLTKITIDVFGFSRGAAAARNFVHEVNVLRAYQPEKKSQTIFDTTYNTQNNVEVVGLPNQRNAKPEVVHTFHDHDGGEVQARFLRAGFLPKAGHLGYSLLSYGVLTPEELDKVHICIRFIGLFDTVSSYEPESDKMPSWLMVPAQLVHDQFNDDVEQLQLNTLGRFQQAVHFTAMDEHRDNFSLTRLVVKGENVIERDFPGVHCDVGGSYMSGTEYVDEIETSNHKRCLEKRCQYLIDQSWFKPDEISIKEEDYHKFINAIGNETIRFIAKKYVKAFKKNPRIYPNTKALSKIIFYRKISGFRFLRKEYSYIPLHFMADLYAKPFLKDKLLTSCTDAYSIEIGSGSGGDVLVNAKEYLMDTVIDKQEKWIYYSDMELKNQAAALLDVQAEEPDIPQPIISDKLDGNKELFKEGILKTDPIYADILNKKTSYSFAPDIVLRKLRNSFLHWSANREWFGMDQAKKYQRKEYGKDNDAGGSW